ncbi:MAG: hypothetical protein AB7O26_11540, partial [Planctomycetaceae bacterium]
GKMSLGGGGFGGGGLPYPSAGLQLWGGAIEERQLDTPSAPVDVKDDGTGAHRYAIIAVDVGGKRTAASREVQARGFATLRWDSVVGGDAYVILRDGKEIAGPLRVEGSQKIWTDPRER